MTKTISLNFWGYDEFHVDILYRISETITEYVVSKPYHSLKLAKKTDKFSI